jgi:hypothetical protein
MPDWLIAILPIVGLVLGATLQYIFTQRHARNVQQMQARVEVYADYLTELAARVSIIRIGPDGERIETPPAEQTIEERRRYLVAKNRMAVYGSKRVVEAMAALHRTFGGPESDANLVRLTQEMRRDGLGDAALVDPRDIGVILQGAPVGND